MGTGREDILRQIGSDPDLKQEILTSISELPNIGNELVAGHIAEIPASSRGLESLSMSVSADDANNLLEAPPPMLSPDNFGLEAIILRLGRPVLKIRNDDFNTAELGTDVWSNRLENFGDGLRTAILSVGRIELENNLNFSWVGTGWVVAEDIIVTNRHVASVFAQSKEGRYVFRQSIFGTMEARIDFREEHMGGGPAEYQIVDVLHIEGEDGPDLAFLRIDWTSNTSEIGRVPLRLMDEVTRDHFVATIGYPAKDTRTNISAEMDAIFGNIYDVKRLAPGQVMQIFPGDENFAHDCTTLGGNSGSVVFDMETGEAMGLHFAGREELANFAVSAQVVKDRLEKLSTGVSVPPPLVTPPPVTPVVDEVEIEEAPSVESLGNRTGYDPHFLGHAVPLPALSSALEGDIAPVSGRDDGLLNYTHYSVLMSTSRHLAIYTACNIDGRQWRQIPRGRDRWFFDPRMDRSFQTGNELYKTNKLDRGHLVRRMDPAWGSSFEEAKTAEEDTFFYTNCAPQHLTLNRDLWLGLEDYILGNASVFDLKVSVFGGPVFRPTDRTYRGIQIPEDFWKVVAIVREDTEALSVTAYLLSQRDFMDDLEFAFGAYRTYQVPLMEVENLTGLDFGLLKAHDPLSVLETRAVVPLDRLEMIDF